MRIAIDVSASLYEGTGVATYYRNLIPVLKSYATDHELVTFGYSLRRLGDLTLADRRFPLPPRLMDIVWNKLHRLPIERLLGEIDVLHAWDYIQPPTLKAKLVTTIHDLTPLKFPQYHLPSTRSAYADGLRWVKRQAAAVIVDSQATQADLVELLQIPQDRIHVIYLAAPIQFEEFLTRHENTRDTSIQQVKTKHGINTGYILAVGTQEPRKNLSRVIQAYQALTLDMPLVIVGRPGWGTGVRSTEKVRVLGLVADLDLPPLYAGASLLVYPSLYEGFGLPVLEAMAVGTPVVTSDRGSLKEVAGDAAVLVNPESVEAIAFGINTALKLSDELIQKGRRQAKQFSWDKTAQETLMVYEKVGSLP